MDTACVSTLAGASPQRVIGLWLPDWPVQAAVVSGIAEEEATAVNIDFAGSLTPIALVGKGEGNTGDTGGNAVVVRDCSSSARRLGVRRGQRRRHAQATCPGLVVIHEDGVRDAQEFEPIVARLDAVAAGVEALRPGFVVMNAKGPVGYYGSEDAAMEKLLDAAAVQGVDCCVGIADDVVTAVLATRRNLQLPAGAGAEFRSQVSLREVQAEVSLGFPSDLAKTWHDLGLRTLGDVVAIPARDMSTRFGAEGVRWRQLAEYGERQLVAPRQTPVDVTVAFYAGNDTGGGHDGRALQRVDEAAFVAKSLAASLHEKLGQRGYLCQRLAVTAEFSDNTALRRVWRCAEPLTELATADRVRWQLDGWLSRRQPIADGDDVDYGIVSLTLEPLDVVDAGAIKDPLWGKADESARRAKQAAVRVQGILGVDAVARPVLVGGRGPSERIAMVPIGEEAPKNSSTWHGAIPAPHPPVVTERSNAHIRHPSAAIRVLDQGGNAVVVTGRATLTGKPHTIVWGGKTSEVTAWAGPWPIDERWWVPDDSRRAARMQLAIEGAAFLLVGSNGTWRIEGKYQ